MLPHPFVYAFSINLYKSVTNITDATAAVMAIDAWMDGLFQVDLSHLSYKEQAEIDRILYELSQEVSQRENIIITDYKLISRLDFFFEMWYN